MEIATPKRDYGCDCQLAPRSYVDVSCEEGKMTPVVFTGVSHQKVNKNEPPSLKYDFAALIGVVDGLKRGDPKKVYSSLKTVFAEPLEYTSNGKPVTPAKKSEAQVEHVLMQSVDLNSYGKLEYVNPSRGTVFRVMSKFPGLVRFTRDVDTAYKDGIKMALIEQGHRYDESDWSPSDDVFYYLSFNGTLGRKMRMKHYLGFELNPASLVNAGLCSRIRRIESGYELNYGRGGHSRTYKYHESSRNITPLDTLHRVFRGYEAFRPKMGLMHDMYSTENIYNASGEITSAHQLTFGCRILEGDFYHDSKGIYSRCGERVYTISPYAHSCRKLHPAWKRPRKKGISTAVYMLSMYSATVTYLGKKVYIRPAEKGSLYFNGKFYRKVALPRGGNDLAIQRGKIVPNVLLPYNLMQGVGHQYCTSSYENVVSVGMEVLSVDLTAVDNSMSVSTNGPG